MWPRSSWELLKLHPGNVLSTWIALHGCALPVSMECYPTNMSKVKQGACVMLFVHMLLLREFHRLQKCFLLSTGWASLRANVFKIIVQSHNTKMLFQVGIRHSLFMKVQHRRFKSYRSAVPTVWGRAARDKRLWEQQKKDRKNTIHVREHFKRLNAPAQTPSRQPASRLFYQCIKSAMGPLPSAAHYFHM